MELKDIFIRVQNRIQTAKEKIEERKKQAGDVVYSIVENIQEEWVEQAFEIARKGLAPSSDELPVDFQLRQSGWLRRVYEKIFPVSHVFRLSLRYGREFLDEFMPISPDAYIGRGSYKFVYRLPWRSVVKVSRSILPSDPIFGSMYREVVKNPEKFLSSEERALFEYLLKKRIIGRDRLAFQFHRLGMERYHYHKVREALPDLVLPTRFFMGVRYRKKPSGGYIENILPMDHQIMLAGKHLKEFARAGKFQGQSAIMHRILPRYEFVFDGLRFGRVKKQILLKITDDFRRLIEFTEKLAVNEKRILDIHTENIIITLPEFELKIFDFHIFDEHLYEPGRHFDRAEKNHVEIIEKFMESLHLDG